MQSLIIPFNETDTFILSLIDRLRSQKKEFRIEPIEIDSFETVEIRKRLSEKYSSKWDNMNDDDRQDAVLLEKMIWAKEQPDNKTYSIDESKDILKALKNELYAS